MLILLCSLQVFLMFSKLCHKRDTVHDLHEANSDSNAVSLTLLATTDVHAHLLAYDYYSDQLAPKKSALSRLSTLIHRERAQNPNVLLVDNGDFLQGTPLSDLITDLSPPDTITHPVVEAMNCLNYDAAALGNHEFNTPLTRLSEILRQMRFPLLCANLTPTGESAGFLQGLWQKHVIVERQFLDQSGGPQTVKIGLFGALPPQVVNWDSSRVSGKICAQDNVTAARKAVQALRDLGADIVIGLAHTGVSTEHERANIENAGLHIAGIHGIDALVLGHTHLRFPSADQPCHPDISEHKCTISGVPSVMPGSGAAYLGKIQLTLEKKGASWAVQSHKAELIPAMAQDQIPQDPDFVSRLTPAHNWVLQQVREPVGTVPFSIHSYFAMLPGCNSVRLVAHVQAEYLRKKLAGTPLADLPLLSAATPQKCGGRSGPDHYTEIPAGPVALRHITDIQFFPNDVSALLLKGAEVSDWLEMSAGFYNQVVPGLQDQPLRDENFPPYNSDAIFGLTYQIDLRQPPRFDPNGRLINPHSRRVHNIRHQGRQLDPAQKFVLAVNNYRSGGGGGFPHVSPDRIVFQSDTKIRDLLVKSLASSPTLDALPKAPWSFTAIPGASVVFETSQNAKSYMNDTDFPDLSELGTNSKGFLQMRLSLAPQAACIPS